MLRLASDEDVNGNIIRGLRHHAPQLDLVRVVDAGLSGASDPRILEWAAAEGKILITQDVKTMVNFAWDRVKAGQPMPGVIAIRSSDIGRAIADILLIAEYETEEGIRDQVKDVPL